jgi:hypothetical protein
MTMPHRANERRAETSHGRAIERVLPRFPTHTIGPEKM